MTLWILDTDCVSLFQRQYRPVVQQVQAKSLQEIGITVVTLEEQLRGWLAVLRRANDQQLSSGYAKLVQTLQFFSTAQLLDFSPEAAAHYSALKQMKLRVGTQDLRIAAIVLSVNGILVTRNQRDFAQVPDLMIQDWTRKSF